jgi:hypothetical protein
MLSRTLGAAHASEAGPAAVEEPDALAALLLLPCATAAASAAAASPGASDASPLDAAKGSPSSRASAVAISLRMAAMSASREG